VENPSIHPEALEYLQSHHWPGNVRELENVIRKVLLLAHGYTINTDHVRVTLAKATAGPAAEQPFREYAGALLAAAQRGELQDARARLLDAAEREIFSRAIELAHGNQAKAARWLGISRLTMREKLIQFGLHPAQEGPGGG
jgi:DNA-binding NtrC family response regulator